MHMTHGACEKIESHSLLGACHCTNIFALIGHLFCNQCLNCLQTDCFQAFAFATGNADTDFQFTLYTIHMFDTMHNVVM